MKKRAFVFIFLLAASLSFSQDEKPGTDKPADNQTREQRINTIRYGTDTEIANLIKTLRSEQPQGSSGESEATQDSEGEEIDKALVEVASKTKNRNILSGVFGFFGDSKKAGLEERAVKALTDRDDEAFETVSAAIDYLGRLEYSGAEEPLLDILNGEESRFMNASIRALGRIAAKNDPEKTADYLVDYYTNKDPGDENRREIIIALGESKSKKGVPFLVSIAENEDERVPLRMAALSGLASVADEEGLPAILKAASSADSNVRASAVAALGPFEGEEADAAILEAFRDSYYRARIAAAQAAKNRKLEAAVPYLIFRCENDDVPQVRDEAVKALGEIGSADGQAAVDKLFAERKNSDRLRITAAEMLMKTSPDSYTAKITEELDYAKSKNQQALYNGFLRVLGTGKSGSLKDLARRFFASGGIIEKSYALDICRNNGFKDLEGEIKTLSEDKNASIARKAKSVLESWESE